MQPFDFSTLSGLVSQYSPSGNERGVVAWLMERMHALGFSETFVDGVGNAVGVMGTGPRQVLLLGHIDTVPGEIPVRVVSTGSTSIGRSPGEVLYGRGSVDAKGPLACFVDAVARIGPVEGWQFVVIGAVDEERESLGARFVAPLYHPEFAMIGEPNRWDRIGLGYKGSAWANVTVRRPQAHSASQQESACEEVIGVWNRAKAWVEVFNNGRGKVFEQVLLSLRAIQSGQEGFEDWATCQIGARLPIDLSPDAWYSTLMEFVADGEIERIGFAVPAYQCDKNTALVRAFLSSIREMGGKPSFVFKSGTADLNIVAPVWKCPVLVYGPGDSALDHTPNEHIELGEYEKAVKVLATAIEKLIM